MHLAGLTAREIADLCHRGAATVHYHLQRREHYEPGFRSKHEAALAARGKNRPSTRGPGKNRPEIHAKGAPARAVKFYGSKRRARQRV